MMVAYTVTHDLADHVDLAQDLHPAMMLGVVHAAIVADTSPDRANAGTYWV